MRDFLVYLVGHSIANVRPLHDRWHDIRYRDVTFRVNIHCFSTPGADLESYLTSPAYVKLCQAPSPDLVLVFIGGNDIKEDTVVAELQANITKFCKHIEEVTNSFAKVFMIEPRNSFRGVEADTYNRIRNSFNRNIQHRSRDYYRRRFVVTPLRFEYLALDGVHPNRVGSAKLVHVINRTIGSFLFSWYASEARQ